MLSELKARKNVPVKLWIPVHLVESSALDQLKNVSDLPRAYSHIAAMPDVHTGMGATIGTVIAMEGAVIPTAVGVDIGCGMEAVKTSIDGKSIRKKRLEKIRDEILDRIPVGFNCNDKISKSVMNHPLFEDFGDLNNEVQQYKGKAQQQLGTLGGGNHFIELSVDDEHNVWIVLHSGSRRIGKEIADFHIARAREQDFNQTGLPDKALSSLHAETPEFDNYMHDLKWAQDYATENRNRMLLLIMEYLSTEFPSVEFSDHISCHHNFAQVEEHDGKKLVIIRKGAIQAEERQMGIIPGSMSTSSYIVRGKGCAEAFNSAPHGAGRKMSRSKARKKYQLSDLNDCMGDIVCNATRSTVDEIQYAYKKIDDVMQYAGDLVEPVYRLNQIMNIKG